MIASVPSCARAPHPFAEPASAGPADEVRAPGGIAPRRFRHAIAVVVASAGLASFAAKSPPDVTGHYVHEGVAVDFTLLPATASAPAPTAGEPARVRFAIRDTTTGRPLGGLHPAAWLSRKIPADAAMRPQTAAEKVRELLGGSIFSRAELDLNNYVVLVLNDDATVSAIDPQFGFGSPRVLGLLKLPGIGEDWALTADRNRLFVSVPSAGKVAAINTANWSIAALVNVGASPRRVALQPDFHYVWAGCDDNGVAVITAADATLAARITTGRGPHRILFSANSRWAFVVNAGDRTLSVIDIHTLRKTQDVLLGCAPAGAAYSRLADAVLLSDSGSGAIVVLDATKHEIVTRISAEPGIAQVKFAPGDRYALVTVPEHNHVLVIDAATNRIVQQADIEDTPDDLAFSNDMGFVVSRDSPSIRMLPLGELGREGQPVAVAEFPGGDHTFGRRASLGDTLTPAPGEPAIVVANPGDKSVYYYMEGMAAPLGNFSNGSRTPRAVLTLDRSLRERAPGVYETTATLPPSGAYDVVFFLDSPQLAYCFSASIQPGAERASARAGDSSRSTTALR